MIDKQHQEDLLYDEDVSHVATRAELLPTWFKICLTVLIFTHFRELWGIGRVYLNTDFIETESMGNAIVKVVFAAYFLISGLTIVISLLYRVQWKHAVSLGIPIFSTSLLLNAVSLVGYFIGDMQRLVNAGTSIVNVLVLTVVIVNSFRIRKRWAEAVVVK
ncbi:hypothetical protein WJU16_23555 [Chitinophaga pollutisoli]|uniref:Uncharacterized protein n=1 Tax=Chitinophaga pollutisoli TaxID=3133966 RepID=A0ABZ2YN52_9BACT